MHSEVKPVQIHHTNKLRSRLFDYCRVNGCRKTDEHADTAFGKARLNAFNRCRIKIRRNALIYVLAEKAEKTDFFQNYTPKLSNAIPYNSDVRIALHLIYFSQQLTDNIFFFNLPDNFALFDKDCTAVAAGNSDIGFFRLSRSVDNAAHYRNL